MDPSLFDRPVPVFEWNQAMIERPSDVMISYVTNRFQYSIGSEVASADDFREEDLEAMETVLNRFSYYEDYLRYTRSMNDNEYQQHSQEVDNPARLRRFMRRNRRSESRALRRGEIPPLTPGCPVR